MVAMLLLCGWVLAGAAEVPAEELVVEAERARLAQDVPQSVTVVKVDGRLPAGADLGDALLGVPGVTVQRLGGLGALTTVGLRGAQAKQVLVLLDGVPLNADGAAAIDLSELPLQGLDRVEVWRGRTPFAVGADAMGGAVDLRTPSEPRGPGGSVLGGSFDSARADVWVGGPLKAGWSGFGVAQGLTTQGDYRAVDDRGTRFDVTDDRRVVRQNQDVQQLSVVGTLRREGGLSLVYTGLVRAQGVPGPIYAPTPDLRLGVQRHLLGLKLVRPVGAVAADGLVFVSGRAERLDDALGQTGLGPRVVQVGALSAGSQAGLTGGLGANASWAVRAGGRLDVARGGVAGEAQRGVVDAGGQLVGHGLAQRLRAEAGLRAVGLLAPAGGATGALLPQGGLRWAPSDHVSLKGGVARTFRAPELLALVGDEGAVRGNPELRPERGWTVDGGLVAGAGGLRVELGGFFRGSEDEISYVQTSQQVAVPVNLERTRTLGLEAGGTWAATEGVDLRAGLTLMDATQRAGEPGWVGRRVPRVPVWQADARLGLSRGPWSATPSLHLTGPTFVDRANLQPQAGRTLAGLQLAVRPQPGWSVVVDVKNVLGTQQVKALANPLDPGSPVVLRPLEDLPGWPLPGRAVMVGLRGAR